MSSGVPGLWKVKEYRTPPSLPGTARAGGGRSYAVSLVAHGQNLAAVVVEAAGNAYGGAYDLRAL